MRSLAADLVREARIWRRWLRRRSFRRRSFRSRMQAGGGAAGPSEPCASEVPTRESKKHRARPRDAAGWRAAVRRALLHGLAVAGCGAALAVSCGLALAAWRARLEAPAPTRLVLDRQGRFLGEIAAGEIAAGAGAAEDGEDGADRAVGANEVNEVEDAEGVAGTKGAAARQARRGPPDPGVGYWPLEKLPPRVVAATLAIEDRRFAWHPGVDLLSAGRALLQDLRARSRVSGASTLAMQVARLQHPGRRGYLRKLSEAATAVLMTSRYGREEVLRHYLRIVPYGNRVHGIGYAARRYFDKPVEDLSWAEIAFLAALPQAPARMNPFLPDGRLRAVRRGERVLAALAARGVLAAAEVALAREQLAGLRIPYREHRPPEALHALLHLRSLLAGSAAGSAGGAARATTPELPAGPTLHSTLDLDLQREVSWLTWRAVRDWESRGAGNASLLVIDLARHEVLAWVGSTGYFDAAGHGAIDYARVRRSAGSTLKPFLYAQALDSGAVQPATILDDLQRGPGGIANADERFLGPLLPRVALATSRNVPAALLLGRIGLDEGYGLLRRLGLTEGALPARHYGLGMAIGGLPVTLEELARAYLVLAGDGRFAELRWARDQELPAPRRVFSEESVRLVTLFLSDPQARLPSFPRMGTTEYRFPVAVKTGTSTHYHDAWAVAYSTRYLVGAWVGHPGFRAMNHLSGYLSAAELVQRVLMRLHRDQTDGLEDVSFPPPRGFEPVRVCALTGQRATAACDRVFLEWFRPGDEPLDDCRAHQQRAVDRRNGLLATVATPPHEVEVRTFVALPARYAAWQAGAGLPRPPAEPSPLVGDPGGRGAARERRSAAGGARLASGGRAGMASGEGARVASSEGARMPSAGAAALGSGAASEPGAQPEPEAGPGDAADGRSGRVRLRAGAPVHLRITSPESGAHLLRDPETPAGLATLALAVVVDPPPSDVVWYVDGRPFATVPYPYSTRWRLAPGRHTFQVRLPLSAVASRPVAITVD